MTIIAATRQRNQKEAPYHAGDSRATLILSEQSTADTDRLTAGGGAAELASCDLGVFLFDCSSLRSMQEALHLLVAVTQAANNSLPCVLLAAKDDLGMSQVGPGCQLICAATAMIISPVGQIEPPVCCAYTKTIKSAYSEIFAIQGCLRDT